MKTVINILLSVKNINTKHKIYQILTVRGMNYKNIGLYYNLNSYKTIYIY